jgi:hypothetical protein
VRTLVKKIAMLVVVTLMGFVVSQVQPMIAGDYHKNINLSGLWIKTTNSVDSAGNPCPIMSEKIEFFNNYTVTMSNFGNEHLLYRTKLTESELQIIDEIEPDLDRKNLLLVKPNKDFDWDFTPLVYSYVVDEDELTLQVKGCSPAKYKRVVK